MTLFGTMADSGFTQEPVKGDLFIVDEKYYRAYEVKPETVGGGLWIYLTKKANYD